MPWGCHEHSNSHNKHKQHTPQQYIRSWWWFPILPKQNDAPKSAHKWKCLFRQHIQMKKKNDSIIHWTQKFRYWENLVAFTWSSSYHCLLFLRCCEENYINFFFWCFYGSLYKFLKTWKKVKTIKYFFV